MTIFISFAVLISVVSLFASSISMLSASSALLLVIVAIKGNFREFFGKLEKLSSFCIALFASYIIIAFFRQSENIFFIYAMDATNIILKIIIILLLNITVKNDLNFFSGLRILQKTEILIGIFSDLEDRLFEILDRYKTKTDKITNLDKIIVEFIVTVLFGAVEYKNY